MNVPIGYITLGNVQGWDFYLVAMFLQNILVPIMQKGILNDRDLLVDFLDESIQGETVGMDFWVE